MSEIRRMGRDRSRQGQRGRGPDHTASWVIFLSAVMKRPDKHNVKVGCGAELLSRDLLAGSHGGGRNLRSLVTWLPHL